MPAHRKDIQAINDVHTFFHQKKISEDNDTVARILKPYSTFLVKHPFVVLILVNAVVILAGVLATVKMLGASPLPNFSEPTKGFEQRGTTISSKQISYQNLLNSVDKELFQLPSGEREKRSSSFASNTFSQFNIQNTDCLFVYEHERKENLFDHLKSICRLYEEKVINFPGYRTYFANNRVHHLPNYIAFLNDHDGCMHLNKSTVDDFIKLLKSCVNYYKQGHLKSCVEAYKYCKQTSYGLEQEQCLEDNLGKCSSIHSSQCRSHPKLQTVYEMSNLLFNVFHYLTPRSFVHDLNKLTLTTSIDSLLSSDAGLQENFFQPLYSKTLKDLDDTITDGVKIASYNLYNLKYHIFQSEIVLQSMYIVTAILVVVLLIWFYSGSLFIAFMTILCIIYALIISYFVYGRIFQVKFFPFLNMVTLIFVVGIGADDAFVYSGTWKEAQKIYIIKSSKDHIGHLIKWTIHALRHAVLSMLVTSLTTAAAFYANLSSAVTSIKCFGLFAGTTIIVNYLLMITLYPSAVVIHDLYIAKWFNTLFPSLCKRKPIAEENAVKDSFQINTLTEQMETIDQSSLYKRKNSFVNKLRFLIYGITKKLFFEYLPLVIIKLRYILVIALLGIGAGSCVVTFAKPGMKFPSTSEFQMFTSSSPLELFGLKYKQLFSFGSGGFVLRGVVVFGVVDTDNGDKLNPDDRGSVQVKENNLQIFSNQEWLLQFCQNIQISPFYVDSLVCKQIQAFHSSLSEPCSSIRPTCCGQTLTNYTEFDACLRYAVTLQESFNPTHGFLLDKSNNLKTLIIDFTTNYHWTLDYDYNNKIYTEASDWFKNQFSNASDTFIGWWHFPQDFYDLQSSLFIGTKQSFGIAIGASFVVIFLTTGNVLLSLYSIITITFIICVTVGVLILSGWKLNIMESIVFSVAAGLSADFTLHYSVAYRTSHFKENRIERVKSTLVHIGPAVLMGALTTFIAGLVMLPSSTLAYIQMAQFLMLVMFISWIYSTFFFLPLCAIIGPVGSACQLTCTSIGSRRRSAQGNEHVGLEPVKSNSSSNPGGVYYGPSE